MAEDSENSQDLPARVERLEVLLTISRLMNATSNQERLINSIAGEVSEYLDADRCSIWFHDRLTDELYTHVATGIEKGTQIRLPSDRGIAGHVFKSGEVKNVQDTSKEPLWSNVASRQTGYETHTMLAYPLRNRRGEAIGVMQLLNKKDDPGYFTQDDENFLDEVAEQIGGVLDLVLRKDEMSHRNDLLEAQMERLSSFEYLMEDRTVINTVFKYNRKVHYWTGMIGMALLALMAITSLVMVRSDELRSLMLGLHIGTEFGLGYQYYIYTDIVSWITLAICGSGLLMYVYPPLNRWMKAKKDRISRFMLQESVRQLNQNRRVQEGLRKVLGNKDDGKGAGKT
ncbi:MAG: GAF domain-containing protein [Candidatus Latescibacteria bacterium]|nr:GAF domain-containing protein [Candidatus Latescibacterota bacterium]